LALAFAAGRPDAVTYLVMGAVFTADMTGNTVLLGIALITAAGTRAARSACALGGFCVGVLLATRLSAGGQLGAWRPKIVSTPQSIRRSNSKSAAVSDTSSSHWSRSRIPSGCSTVRVADGASRSCLGGRQRTRAVVQLEVGHDRAQQPCICVLR
jgi:hypothetical protein